MPKVNGDASKRRWLARNPKSLLLGAPSSTCFLIAHRISFEHEREKKFIFLTFLGTLGLAISAVAAAPPNIIQKQNTFHREGNCLTEHFTVSEPQNPSICKLYVVWKSQSTDFEALKL